MSGWRIATRAVVDAGHMKCEALADREGVSPRQAHKWINAARDKGLIEPCDGREPGHYRATRLGRDYATGRVREERSNPGGMRFVATWLAGAPA